MKGEYEASHLLLTRMLQGHQGQTGIWTGRRTPLVQGSLSVEPETPKPAECFSKAANIMQVCKTSWSQAQN
jgi:hypothetical protein